MQVNGEWVENATEGDLDAIAGRRDASTGRSTGRRARARRSSCENVWKKDSHLDRGLQAGRRLREAEGLPGADARGDRRDGEEVQPARPRRGRLPDRAQVGLPAQERPKPRYLCVNADESEPGTYKDRLIMENDPHQLIEACIVSSYAIGSQDLLHLHPRRVLTRASACSSKARRRGLRGGLRRARTSWAPASTSTSTCTAAPGAYECGEETALIESLEGKRGQPRLKPPFPAASGPLQLPDHRQQRRDARLRAAHPRARARSGSPPTGTEKNGGPKLYCVSGHVKRPGVYEAPMGKITLRQLIDDQRYGGGMPRRAAQLRAWCPAGPRRRC